MLSFVLWDFTCILRIPELGVFSRIIIVCIFVAKESFIAIDNGTFQKIKIKD